MFKCKCGYEHTHGKTCRLCGTVATHSLESEHGFGRQYQSNPSAAYPVTGTAEATKPVRSVINLFEQTKK